MSFCFAELGNSIGSSVDERQCRKLVSGRSLVRNAPSAQLIAPSVLAPNTAPSCNGSLLVVVIID